MITSLRTETHSSGIFLFNDDDTCVATIHYNHDAPTMRKWILKGSDSRIVASFDSLTAAEYRALSDAIEADERWS